MTKEEWKIGETEDVAIDYETQEWRTAIMCEGSEVGAGYGATPEESEARARLMITAPDLLNALQAAIDFIDHGESPWVGGIIQDSPVACAYVSLANTLDSARPIIAKARDEQETRG